MGCREVVGGERSEVCVGVRRWEGRKGETSPLTVS
jgi:hypothetical protein